MLKYLDWLWYTDPNWFVNKFCWLPVLKNKVPVSTDIQDATQKGRDKEEVDFLFRMEGLLSATGRTQPTSKWDFQFFV